MDVCAEQLRFQAFGTPIEATYSHYSDCRGYTGAKVAVWATFDTWKVRFSKAGKKVRVATGNHPRIL
ncbi:MAG TPA: hypothetical protein VIW27_11745 [Gammaproteobacteria bacterium]